MISILKSENVFGIKFLKDFKIANGETIEKELKFIMSNESNKVILNKVLQVLELL